MKIVTLSADEKLIDAVRGRAKAEHTTLNAEFRRWLEDSTRNAEPVRRYEQVMKELRGSIQLDRMPSRKERNPCR